MTSKQASFLIEEILYPFIEANLYRDYRRESKTPPKQFDRLYYEAVTALEEIVERKKK